MKQALSRGFTLIELLVVISIIALLSSVVVATLTSARVKARDSQRIQNARQIALALEQYEQTTNSYKINGVGLNGEGGGYVAKGDETPGYTNSIISALKSSGYYTSLNLKDPVFGTDNYYLGLCTSTNSYNIFVKLEQPEYNQATSSIVNACGGPDAAANGFSYIASTAGGGIGVAGSGSGGETLPGGTAAGGANDDDFNPGTGTNSQIYAMKIQSDGRILVGGAFTSYNYTPARRIALLNANGSLDASFNTTVGATSLVSDIEIQPDGKIIIAGSFAYYNGSSTQFIAKLNPDATRDTSFNPVSISGSTIYAIAVQPDGSIIVGGDFNTVGGVGRANIARLSATGSLDTTFNPGAGASGYVRDLVIQTDGKILVGGDFTYFGGSTRGGIVRLNTDGSFDTDFKMGVGVNGSVRTIALKPGGGIYIGGNFTTYKAVAASRIALLKTDGSLDTSFDPKTGVLNDINIIKLQPDGKVVIAGYFTTFNGVARKSIARLTGVGALDTTFDPLAGSDGTITAMDIQPDGKIIIAGSFTLYNGTARKNIARIK